jgi:lysozyme family protein
MIYEADFETAFGRVVGTEGGFTKDMQDRGNWTSGIVGQGILKGTKFGISAMSYPDLDIENLTIDAAKDIYHRDWWVKFNMELFRPALNFQMFDAGINHGMVAAEKMLQRAVKVADDGHIGPQTMAAIDRMPLDDILARFLAERLEFMTNVVTWQVYGKGWARRIASNLRFGAEDTP